MTCGCDSLTMAAIAAARAGKSEAMTLPYNSPTTIGIWNRFVVSSAGSALLPT